MSIAANIYPVAAVREMDRIAIEDNGVPGYTLMQRAGAAAVDDAMAAFPDTQRWQVVCGGGNNGGDGYVVARLAGDAGIVVSVVTLVSPDTLGGDAEKAYMDFVATGGHAIAWSGELDPDADLVVDAVLGSGLQRDVGGEFADAVAAINAHQAPVHALDIATGINGDTGHVMGSAVVADLTTTFVGLNSGLFLGDGAAHCGAISFADLDIPPEWLSGIAPAFRHIDDELISAALPRRPRDSHKGDFGHVLVVGGGAGMPGAVRLCGEAALRAGAGLVSIATDPAHAGTLAATRPELMVHGVSGGDGLEQLLEMADVVAFGPGLGQSDWAQDLFAVVSASDKPSVWDADALNLLAESPNTSENRVLTPHPGEAGRLIGISTAEVQADRSASLESLRQEYGGTVVLKGAGTLVASGGSVPWLCTGGNPGMASAGMGDVLTGIIAALLAQGVELEHAAAVGVGVHASAGDLAAWDGERGMLASDLISNLRTVVNP